MKKKPVSAENYLEKTPVRKEGLIWNTDENGVVTLEVENTGVFNRIAQALLGKPKITFVHLDEMGSFIWPLIDGNTDIIDLGKAVEVHFGDKAQPLYERLAKYLQILESYGFITWKEK